MQIHEISGLTAPINWLDRAAVSTPDAVALRTADGVFSYSQLQQRVTALCHALQLGGLCPGMSLVVNSSSRLLISLLIHAAPRCGICLFPVDSKLPQSYQKPLFRDAGIDAVVLDQNSAKTMGSLIQFDSEELLKPLAGNDSTSSRSLELRDIHLMIATSGSSGDPKVVMLSGRNLAASVTASRRCLGLGAGDRWLNCLPLYHIGGAAIVYRCAEAGATLLLHEQFDPAQLLIDLQHYNVSHISLVPAMLAQLLKASGGRKPPDTLRVALVGGDALSPALARQARAESWPLHVTYGMTETCSQLATDSSDKAGVEFGAVGRPLDGFEIEIGLDGEIWVRGEAVMTGYANPEKVPGQGVEDGWFQTGDLGMIYSNGELMVNGRADESLTSGGETFHPNQVERLLSECPGVEASAVSSAPNEIWGDRLVAWVVGEITEEALQLWCRANFPTAIRPREVFKTDTLPRNSMGKVDRCCLQAWTKQRLRSKK